MATSYFRERARNPYLKRAPGLEDDPNVSPTFSRPMPMAPEVIERPPLRAVAPPASTLAPDPIETARTAYEAQVPTTTKGRILEALKTAGLGFLQGAARDRENPLAAGIGGAVAGGGISAVSPKTGRGFQFETLERPRLEDQMRREEDRRKRGLADEDRARAISMDDLKRRGMEANLADIQAQTRGRAVSSVPQGSALVNTTTGQPIYQSQPQPRAESTEFSSSPLGIFNRKTGQVTTPAPAKPAKPPPQAESGLKELAEMKQSARELWRQSGQLLQGSTERQEAESTAREALAAYNQSVASFGERYGEWFETGQGTGGWSYTKRRQGQAQGAKPVARPAQPTANLRDLERLWK